MTAAELRARVAASRKRYVAKHQADDPLPDPELVACSVALPAYLEPSAHLVPIPEQPDRRRADVEHCIRNRDRGGPGRGDRGKLGSEV